MAGPVDGELNFLWADTLGTYGDKSFDATVKKKEELMSQVQTGIIELKSKSAAVLKGHDTSSFTPVKFTKPFPQGYKVIVVPMTQTFNGPDTPGVRIADVTTEGFKIRMNELVSSSKGENHALSNGFHVCETIGWVAYSVGNKGDTQEPTVLWNGTLEASAKQGVKSGVTLSKGEVISITVTGSASLGPDHNFYPEEGPNGMPNTVGANKGVILPSANMGAVLMKIGSAHLRFLGTGVSNWTVPEDGEIAFFYNTVPAVYSTASGSFDITLTS